LAVRNLALCVATSYDTFFALAANVSPYYLPITMAFSPYYLPIAMAFNHEFFGVSI
jgi:hypothetical protein